MKKTERLVEKCRLFMADGSWWSIPAMAASLGCTQTGAAARIRDLRKARYGNHQITKRPIGGVYEYRLVPQKEMKHG